MLIRYVLWDLNDARVSIEELRAYLREESVDAFSRVRGLRFKAWISNEEENVWGAFYLWESPEASRQELPSRAAELIGKPPDVVRWFDLEASAEGVYESRELARRGLAFEDLSG